MSAQAHAFHTPPLRPFCLRPAILRHDPGLAASPPVRYKLKVEGVSTLLPFIVRYGRTISSQSRTSARRSWPNACTTPITPAQPRRRTREHPIRTYDRKV